MHRSSSHPNLVIRRPLSAEPPLPLRPRLNPLLPIEVQHRVVFEQEEGSLDVVEGTGKASMRLPSGWRDKQALLSVIEKVKGGQDVWISAEALHLRGPRARHILTRLAVVLRVLRALDVSDEKATLDILRATPSLMVDAAKQPVKLTLYEHGARLKGDARWLQSLIADLACHSPSLACRIFLNLLDHRARWTLLSHHPSTFDALVARVENKEDQEALQAYFERGLTSEMSKPRGARYIAVWMVRCPSWAEASLNGIWSMQSDESKEKWLKDYPALSEILARWMESCSQTSGVRIDDVDRQQPLKIDLIGLPNQVRQDIRNHFTQILRIAPTRDSVQPRHSAQVLSGANIRKEQFGVALKKCGLLPGKVERQETRLFFHCALSAVSAEMKTTQVVESEPLEWLLSQLFKEFARDFSVIASSALAHLVAFPFTKQLTLDGQSGDGAVEFASRLHVCQIVRRMIGWCHATPDFQSRLRLRKEVKDELAVMAGEDPFVWLAPTGQKDGFTEASWKVQFLWRDEWLKDKGMPIDDHHRCIETAAILNAALDQEAGDGIQEQDMDDIVFYVLKDKSPEWLHSLLTLKFMCTARPAYRRLVACLALKCANTACVAGDETRATEFIAMLCRSPFLFDDDLERVAWSVTAVVAISLKAIKQLQKALSSDPRGLKRMYLYLWTYCLAHSEQPDHRDWVAKTVGYLDALAKEPDFGYLKESSTKVMGLFERHRSDPRRHQSTVLMSQVEEQEGGAFMRSSPSWENTELLSALKRIKGVRGEPWISGGMLHVRGSRAGYVLGRLAFVCEMLSALGVRNEEEALHVLLRTPTLMVQAREPGVKLTVADGRPCLTGDVQWLQAVILDLAGHAPSLACLAFLCMTPEGQWTMLSKYSPTFDVLTVRIDNEVDRELLLAHFYSGLMSEFEKDSDARRISVWIARCPPWAEASLGDLLSKHGKQHMADQWFETGASVTAAPIDEVSRSLKPDPEALVARYQPDTILERVRSAKYPQEGGLAWRTGVRYIRHQFHEILRGATDRALRYGNAVETINCLRRENQAELFFSCAFIVFSSSLKNEAAQGDALDWLLDRLYKNYARHFSAAASHAFARHLPLLLQKDRSRLSASTPRYALQLPWQSKSLAIPFAQLDHATQVLAQMIARCRADRAFQLQLQLREEAKQGLIALFPSASTSELLASLAPAGFQEASWKVQLLWRDDWSVPKPVFPPLQKTPQILDSTADILKNALDQGGGKIPERDMDDIVAYLLSRASDDWIKCLLEKYPKDKEYRELVVCLVVKRASSAYGAKDSRATGLIALLCESKIVTGNDLRVAARYMMGLFAIQQQAIEVLLRELSRSNRAQQRACFWIYCLLSSKPADQGGGMADTLRQLGVTFEGCEFTHLTTSERIEVTEFLKKYKSEKGKLPK